MLVGLVVLSCTEALVAVAEPMSASEPLTIDVVVHANTGLGEPQIALDPHDPTTVVVGENNSGVSVSHDRGLTWRRVPLPNPGDNVLTVTPDRTFVYSALDGDVNVSSDGGTTWPIVGNWVGQVAAMTQGLPARSARALAGMQRRGV